jgi:VIT1/CCC1 family predicted Fe2+/Mn2+ transporter
MLMDKGTRTGLFFGATSGVITTLGLMVGLEAGTQSLAAVFGGVVVIAVSDAMSDAMGIHLSEEADPESTRAHIWAATMWTFIAKFVVSISFSLPLLWMPLKPAVIVGVAWGLIIITVMSYFLARLQQAPVWRAIGEHLAIALVVIAVSHYVGIFTRSVFV